VAGCVRSPYKRTVGTHLVRAKNKKILGWHLSTGKSGWERGSWKSDVRQFFRTAHRGSEGFSWKPKSEKKTSDKILASARKNFPERIYDFLPGSAELMRNSGGEPKVGGKQAAKNEEPKPITSSFGNIEGKKFMNTERSNTMFACERYAGKPRGRGRNRTIFRKPGGGGYQKRGGTYSDTAREIWIKSARKMGNK